MCRLDVVLLVISFPSYGLLPVEALVAGSGHDFECLASDLRPSIVDPDTGF